MHYNSSYIHTSVGQGRCGQWPVPGLRGQGAAAGGAPTIELHARAQPGARPTLAGLHPFARDRCHYIAGDGSVDPSREPTNVRGTTKGVELISGR